MSSVVAICVSLLDVSSSSASQTASLTHVQSLALYALGWWFPQVLENDSVVGSRRLCRDFIHACMGSGYLIWGMRVDKVRAQHVFSTCAEIHDACLKGAYLIWGACTCVFS